MSLLLLWAAFAAVEQPVLTVVESGTKSPLEGAQVRFYDVNDLAKPLFFGTTDGAGRITCPRTGPLRIVIDAIGHEDENYEYTVKEDFTIALPAIPTACVTTPCVEMCQPACAPACAVAPSCAAPCAPAPTCCAPSVPTCLGAECYAPAAPCQASQYCGECCSCRLCAPSRRRWLFWRH